MLDWHPPLGGRLWARTCAVWCWLMHGSYGQGEGTNGGRLRVFSITRAPWRVLLQACQKSSRSWMSSTATWTNWTCALASPRTATLLSLFEISCSAPVVSQKRAPIKPWRAQQAKILRVRLASLAASSILHVGLGQPTLRPRVRCGISPRCWTVGAAGGRDNQGR